MRGEGRLRQSRGALKRKIVKTGLIKAVVPSRALARREADLKHLFQIYFPERVFFIFVWGGREISDERIDRWLYVQYILSKREKP